MKAFKPLLTAMAAALLTGVATTSCSEDFDGPGLQIPVSTLKPNMTISEFKTKFWLNDNAYVNQIGQTDDGQDIVLSGRVISSDASGNIYKNLVIQDETGALTMSINANSLYNNYRIGQQIMVKATGMYVGKYRGLLQLCFPSKTDQGTLEGTFMPLEVFKEHIELNELPKPSLIDTLVISHSDYASSNPSIVRQYQSQLVRFDNVHFKDGGKLNFTDGSKITSNRTLVFANGDTINVRTSGYSNFYAKMLPEGEGSVVGILGYFNSGNTADPWQLNLRSIDDLIGFGDEPEATQGTRENPWSVDQVVEKEQNGTGGSGWLTGYIVGAVVPGTTAVTSNDQIEWTSDVSMPNTLVIAPAPEVKDAASCLVVELPQGSALRQYGNLLDNPSNYKKQIWLDATFAKVLGTWGATVATGSAKEFEIDGVTVPGEPVTPPGPDEPSGDPVSGEVTFVDCSLPANPTEFVSGNFKFVLDKGAGKTAPAYHTGSQAIRLYADNTITISTVDGAPIDKMVFTLSKDAGYKYTTFTPSTGTLAPQAKGDTQMSWTGFANTVTFTVGNQADFGTETGYGQIRITKVVFGGGGSDKPDNPDKPDVDKGTHDSPYSVAEAIAHNNPGKSAWVEGYIVGWADGSASAAVFNAAAQTSGNILLAASTTETSAANCLVVNLPKGQLRNALNLMDNPANLGKKIMVQGTLSSYLGGHGLTAPTAWEPR